MSTSAAPLLLGTGTALSKQLRAALVVLALAVGGCAHGPYVEPADFSDSLSDEQVPENFMKIAFGNEFEPESARLDRLFKWRGPINIVFLDAITQREREQIETHLSRISAITGLVFFYGEPRRGAELAIRVNNTKQIVDDLKGFRSDPRMSENGVKSIKNVEQLLTMAQFLGRTDQQCIFFVGPFHPRWSAYVAIHSDLPEEEFWYCVVEELTQVFGLPNDNYSVEPSIFNDDERYRNLTRHDVWLLQLLYDPAVKPGMTQQEVRKIIEDRVAFYRRQTEARAR